MLILRKPHSLLFFIALFCFISCSQKIDEEPKPKPSGNDGVVDDTPITMVQKSFSVQPDASTGQDAVIGLSVPNNNYGSTDELHLYTWTESGDINITRFAVGFDLSSIPSNAQVDSAYLYLNFNTSSFRSKQHDGDDLDFWVKRIVAKWDEKTITWNKQPLTSSDNQVGVSGPFLPQQNFKINVSTLAKDMIKNPSSSFGFMLSLKNEVPYKRLLLASSNHANAALRPKLSIFYSAPK